MDRQLRASFRRCAGIYSLLFIVVLGMICAYFAARNLSLVLGGDPVAQHLRALIYYGRWLRELPGYLLREHRLPAFSYSIGLGSDILTTLHFYVIGDPLNLLAAFVPTAYMAYLYSILIILRMYLAGLSFIFLCFTAGRTDTKAVNAGAVMYVFSAYTIFAGWRHPFFLNPMICLPLVIAGAEKVRREGSHTLLCLSVAFSVVSNFYFFYMIVLFTVCFALVQGIGCFGKDLRKWLSYLLHLLLASATGVMIGAVMLLPVIMAFLNNPRSASGYIFDPLYNSGYYLKFFGSMFSFWAPGDFCYMGFPGIALIAFVLLFCVRGRKTGRYRAFFILCIAALLLPAAGYVLNGFSYVTTRWVWVFTLTASYCLVLMWDEMLRIRRSHVIACVIVILLPAVLSAHPVCAGSRLNLWIELGMALLWLIAAIVVNRNDTGNREKSLRRLSSAGLALVCAGVCVNCLFGLVTEWGGMGHGYRSYDRVAGDNAEQFDTEAALIRQIEGTDGFYRYSGKGLSGNASVQDGAPSTQFYWSLANGYVSDFFEEMGLCYSYGNAFAAFDDRTVLNEIAGVKDFYTLEEEHVPFGYELLSSEENPKADRYPLYRNAYTLPLGIAFADIMLQGEYNTLDPAAKQEVLLTHAVVCEGAKQEVLQDAQEKGLGVCSAEDLSLARTVQDLEVKAVKGKAVIEGMRVTALEDKAKIRFTFSGTPGSETYLYLGGMEYQAENVPERLSITVKAYCGKEKVMTRKLSWFTPREEWYVGRNSFMFPSGYREEAVTSFTLTFPKAGVYTFADMQVFTQPLGEDYAAKARMLQEETLENVNLHTSAGTTTWACAGLDGEITLTKPSLLCLQLAYSPGWSAKVDGKKVPVYRTDTMFMGILLEKGPHVIEMVYETPGFKAGLLLTLAGLCILLIVRRNEKAKRRK